MALGVLNNLSAMYAENNLNNTSNSLQTVLQQLSSGSKINSGADDAAGLSLVNGLEANQTALMQSETNATEGVGLLDVADGALSQVTSMLDRAITLATEASNGTLNSTQEAAANQEYQSILAEVNNIGSTTTYNQQQVFTGNTVAIYTGDSSAAGSSIDDLNIRTLSESSVGDTGGTMSYSDGTNNVFLNLSTGTQNATINDTLNASGSTTIDVTYLVPGASGSSSTAMTSISVGGTTNYANTASGLISAINNAGLGLTANFSTQAQAGVTGLGTQTGIEISGGMVSAGVDPSASSASGMLNVTGIPAGELLTQGQTITIKMGGTTVGSPITISPTVNTLSELAATINGWNGGNSPVTASVVTNGNGTQSLSLADTAGGGALTVATTAGAGAAVPTFVAGAAAGNAPTLAAIGSSSITGTAATAAQQSTVTFGIAGTNSGTDVLAAGGSVTLTNTLPAGTQALTFIVGSGTDTATTFYTGNHGTDLNTLSNLMTTINAEASTLGASATLAAGNAGITMTTAAAATGENITASLSGLANVNASMGLYLPTDGGAASVGTPQITAIDAGAGSTQDDVLATGGHITLANATGGSVTFTATAGQTYADLALAINNSNLGVTASFSSTDHALLLTSTTNGPNAITASNNTLTDSTLTHAVGVDAANAGAQTGTAGAPATFSTAVLQLNNGQNLNDGTANLAGQIQIQNGSGTTQTFIMGTGVDTANTFYTGAGTVASLVTAINSDAALGITASAPGTGTGGIYLQSTTSGTGHAITTPGVTTLASTVAMAAGATVNGVTAAAGQDSSITVGVAAGGLSTSDTLATGGSISITNGTVTESFTVGTGSAANTTYLAPGSTLAQLAQAISGFSALGLNAVANTTGLALSSSSPQGTPITVNSSSIQDATQGSFSTETLGGFASESDTASGSLIFTVGGSGQTVTATNGETVGGLISQIDLNTSTLGVTAKWVAGANGFGSVEITSNTEGTAGQISGASSTVTDTTATASLTYTAADAYKVGLSSAVSAGNAVYDSTTGQTMGAPSTFVLDTRGSSGVATVSYSDGAGQALNTTDLLNQSDASIALNDLNVAITDVAAQDGYLGAQINTLNSVSQVMNTQQENVLSAQNAIQATDYASATSNMSKYEILSQTGIAALAQANTVQQEVTKLLQ
jgi:flagellin